MIKRRIASSMLCALLAACSATTQVASAESSGASLATARQERTASAADETHCEVRLTRTRHGVRIEALAHSVRAAQGEYELVITKSGPGGDSDIVQGGPFDLGSDAEARLSAAEFNVGRGDHYRAQLSLRSAGGELCRDERGL